jgi:hypothetical protein
MPKSLKGERLKMDKASGVICFPLSAREEDPLPPLHSPHRSVFVSVLMSGKQEEWEEVRVRTPLELLEEI